MTLDERMLDAIERELAPPREELRRESNKDAKSQPRPATIQGLAEISRVKSLAELRLAKGYMSAATYLVFTQAPAKRAPSPRVPARRTVVTDVAEVPRLSVRLGPKALNMARTSGFDGLWFTTREVAAPAEVLSDLAVQLDGRGKAGRRGATAIRRVIGCAAPVVGDASAEAPVMAAAQPAQLSIDDYLRGSGAHP